MCGPTGQLPHPSPKEATHPGLGHLGPQNEEIHHPKTVKRVYRGGCSSVAAVACRDLQASWQTCGRRLRAVAGSGL